MIPASYTDSEIIVSMSKTVKCLALIDILFSFLNLILSPIFVIAALISMMFALCGYYGSKNYNKNQVCWYLYYVIIQDIFRVGTFIIYLLNPSPFGVDYVDTTTVVFNSLFILCYFYITYFIIKFYKLLKNYSHEEIFALNSPSQLIVVQEFEV